MTQYELIFDIDALDDSTIEAIYSRHDALISSHSDSTTLVVTADGRTAATASKRIIAELEDSFGVMIRRLVEDLVNKADIASRCDSTPQAVGQWVRGSRRRNSPFPARFNRVGGGVWLWSEVNDWLRRVGRPFDSTVSFPCRKDYDEVNAWIAEHEARRRFTSVHARVHYSGDRTAEPFVGTNFSFDVAGSRMTIVQERVR